ncbi:MAG: enoyl-CoA hydratase/isomerase family protein [Desulfobacterales bacterium]|nr:enoyl-CoA hydratase/isomerase family protein [Desulfobacterales bacterium]
MKRDRLIVEKSGSVCTLILNRPDKMNSLTDDLIREIRDAFQVLAADDSTRAVIIRGAGDKAFCSGYDIRAIAVSGGSESQRRKTPGHPLEPAAEAIMAYPFPVIAMLNGSAHGAGCELAICCDIRVGAEDIRMRMPPARLGIVYPWTGLERFIRIIGLSATREMFFTGASYTGPILKEMGLVNHLTPREELAAFTRDMAGRIAHNAPLALKGTKTVLNLLAGAAKLNEKEIAAAEAAIARAMNSQDLAEGRRAFLEKRRPRFTGA